MLCNHFKNRSTDSMYWYDYSCCNVIEALPLAGCTWALWIQCEKAALLFTEGSRARLKNKSCFRETEHPRITWILRLHPHENKYAYCCQNMSLSSYCKEKACQNKTLNIIQWNGKKKTDTGICQRLSVYLFKAAMHCHFQALVGRETTHHLTLESI